MLEDALKYPFRGENATKRFVIGGALPFLAAAIYLVGILLTVIFIGAFILPFSVVPQVFLWGYVVAVVGALLAGRENPPAFQDWKQFGIDGLKATLVAIAYSIPFIAIVFVFILFSTLTGSFAEQSATAGSQAFTDALTMLFGFVVLVSSLAIYYVLPAAVINFVRRDELTAAFHLRTIRDMTFNGDYLVAWLLAAVVSTVGGLIAIPLYFVLVGFVLQFYTLVVAAYLVTRGSMEAMNWTPQVGQDTDTGPAEEAGAGTGTGTGTGTQATTADAGGSGTVER